jgi:hypothetical protein
MNIRRLRGKKNSLRISGSQHNLFGIVGGTVLATVMSPSMQVICAWCRHEGKPGYLGEREPFDNPAPTHGVCFRHREQFLESLPSTSFPDAEMLIVVRPNDTALYEYLRRNLAGVKGVKVIPERRQADRRREQRAVAGERRHQERRTRQGETFALGYTLFRFKRKPPPGRGIDRVDL